MHSPRYPGEIQRGNDNEIKIRHYMTDSEITINIDGNPISCSEGMTILEAADAAGKYIPRLCHHPDLPAAKEVTWAEALWQGDKKIIGERSNVVAGEDAHCNLCLVEVEGQSEAVNACITTVEDGMIVSSATPEVIQRRKQSLARILADHPHACLTCAQREGCSRTDCSSNVPIEERCCILLGRCELGKVSDYIGIPDYTQKYRPQNRPIIKDNPLFDRDYNLCIGCLRCVRACNDLRGADVLGAVWKDDRAWVGTLKEGALLDAECRFCGACVEVCPTGTLLDKEGVPVVRRGDELPCAGNCPAGIDIPGYLRLIARGQDREALELIRSRVPLPGILGYVCFHPCEENCRRGYLDEPVAICALKRYVADTVADELAPMGQVPTGKKVAVIGAGPAGLTAAYYLQSLGHDVQVFDQSDKPGGMLRYAIPDYRLPPEILEREIQLLERAGIQFQLSRRLGDKLNIDALRSQGFDAIILAVGTPVSKALQIEGADLEGIYRGLEFLRSAKQHREPKLSGKVVVIGGGNVAIDAAMTALRLGADDVNLVCLESRNEMPAHEWEIEQAESEGVIIHDSWGPERFHSKDGRVSGVDLKKCTRVFDEQGRFDPQYDTSVTHYLPADHVIVTIGQDVDRSLFESTTGLEKGRGGILKVDENFATSLDGVFAAGDVVRGPSSVVEAIADGRTLADAVDKYFGGSGVPEIILDIPDLDNPRLDGTPDSVKRKRQKGVTADPSQRKSGFDLLEMTYDSEMAKMEAERCLACHLRLQITPVVLPPDLWLPLNSDSVESIPEAEGVFQLLNGEKKIIRISGTSNVRQSLLECLDTPGDATFFLWEEDPMYTKRESELIQQYLQEHGEMPGGGGGDDLDDLF
jgi:formate dehydrogenase beta subunit